MTFEILPKWKIRRLEWCVAIMTLGFGIFLNAGATSMSGPAYDQLLRWMPESRWGDAFLLTGAAHFTALVINGHAPWTPFVRFGTSCLNLLIFVLFSYGFWKVTPWSTAVFIYGSLGFLTSMCVEGSVKDCFRLMMKVEDAPH